MNAQALVEQAVSSGRLDDLAASLDAAELQAPFAAGDPLAPPWPAAAHLLAHMGNANASSTSSRESSSRTSLDDARFLWRRLPAASREQPSTAAAFALLQALWLPDPVAAWGVLKAESSSFGGGDGALAALAARVASGLRARVAAVLPRAFTRLPLAKAAALLGFEEGEQGASAAFEAFVAGKAGWEVVSGSVLALPRPDAFVSSSAAAAAPPPPSAPSSAAARSAAAALAASEDELAKLSKYILQLEAGA